mmetsp:Transcript_30288/g.59150  ORF Transcript_30288/g.59150 Transcript_30288/m.59150 type:complete len:205 (+) Transcript_30288:2010-2624(+)
MFAVGLPLPHGYVAAVHMTWAVNAYTTQSIVVTLSPCTKGPSPSDNTMSSTACKSCSPIASRCALEWLPAPCPFARLSTPLRPIPIKMPSKHPSPSPPRYIGPVMALQRCLSNQRCSIPTVQYADSSRVLRSRCEAALCAGVRCASSLVAAVLSRRSMIRCESPITSPESWTATYGTIPLLGLAALLVLLTMDEYAKSVSVTTR